MPCWHSQISEAASASEMRSPIRPSASSIAAVFSSSRSESMVDIIPLPFDSALTIVSHTDAPHPLSLLRARHERPRRGCTAGCGQQFPPSDAGYHTPLSCDKGNDTTPQGCSLHVVLREPPCGGIFAEARTAMLGRAAIFG